MVIDYKSMKLYIPILSIFIYLSNIAHASSMPTPYPDGGVPALNGMGAMAPDLDDPITKDFINYAKNLSEEDKILEVGSAYGNLVLELLKTTKTSITANDLDTRHLDILHNRALECCNKDIDRLTLDSGNFSNEKTLNAESYSGIIFHSVLLFMTPEEVERSLTRAHELLSKDGKLYIFARSPYGYESFIPEYKRRLKNGVKWPGFVQDMYPYYKARGHEALYLLDEPALKQLLEVKGFIVQDSFGMEWDKKMDKWVRMDNGSFTGSIAIKK